MINLESYTKEQIKKYQDKHIAMNQALEEITNICENTPQGSKKEILDEALNEIIGISEQYVRTHNERILDYFDKNDEIECGNCDWWGSPEGLEIQKDTPVCPQCSSDDVFDVTKNMGRLL